MEMVKPLVAFALLPLSAAAAGFSLTIGPPVAAGTGGKVTKTKAAFAVRLEECEDLVHAQISATAEGLVNGARTSTRATLLPATQPGVYVVPGTWPDEGTWAVSLTASCGSAKAGAIVPIGPQGFVRESVKQFPGPPSPAEIDAALKSPASR